MSSDAERVAAMHMEGKGTCAQAMLSVYGKYFGVPEELAMKVAAGLGGGMGGMGKTCGAVTGAFLVLGLTFDRGNPGAKGEVYGLVKEFTKRFIARHGSISCADLLGYDMGTEEGLKKIREQGLFQTVCPAVDRSAGEIVEALLAGRMK